jgi:hypothetical protein
MQKTYLSLPDIRESDNFITELSINFYALAFNMKSSLNPDSSSWQN